MKVPNSVAETVLKNLPCFCGNYKRECRQIFHEVETLEEHQRNCEHRLIQCPSSKCSDDGNNYMTIPYNSWPEHSKLVV